MKKLLDGIATTACPPERSSWLIGPVFLFEGLQKFIYPATDATGLRYFCDPFVIVL